MHRCDATRSEKISELVMKMVTGDKLLLGFVAGEGFCELIVLRDSYENEEDVTL